MLRFHNESRLHHFLITSSYYRIGSTGQVLDIRQPLSFNGYTEQKTFIRRFKRTSSKCITMHRGKINFEKQAERATSQSTLSECFHDDRLKWAGVWECPLSFRRLCTCCIIIGYRVRCRILETNLHVLDFRLVWPKTSFCFYYDAILWYSFTNKTSVLAVSQ